MPYVFTITGDPTVEKYIYQNVAVSGSAGDTFVLAGWAKGDAAPLTDDNLQFGLRIRWTNGTTTYTYFHNGCNLRYLDINGTKLYYATTMSPIFRVM